MMKMKMMPLDDDDCNVDATDMSLRDSVKTAKQPGELRELCFSQPSHNKLRKYDGDVLWKRQQLSTATVNQSSLVGAGYSRHSPCLTYRSATPVVYKAAFCTLNHKH